jgi:hypothetical protein
MCPLGAALAIPGRVRMFGWLRRLPEPSDEGNPDPNSLCSNRLNESLETKTANDLIGQL